MLYYVKKNRIVVKLKKELIQILNDFRKGKIEESEIKLNKIKGFEVQKNLVKSQINYFKEDYEKAMSYDEKALPNNDQWYAGNILSEHFFAYSNAAIESNQIKRASEFYKEYLVNKSKLNLPEHKINFYNHQVSQHLQKIEGEKNLIINLHKAYEIKDDGKPIEKIYQQYQRVRESSDLKSKDAIGYILHFLIAYGNTNECLDYYEVNWKSAIMEDSHLKIAQIYKAKKQMEKAKEVIFRFAEIFWYPIEHLQIVPMKLWRYEDLLPLIDKELKLEILKANKEKK